jgi:TetR/AcrR family transcriptional regulator, cholesterol catabolism regulator
MNRIQAPSPLPTVLTPSQEARRQRVIDAAILLSGQREFSRIQVKDVAEEAGVALGTVYHYFSSKEHLFAEVLVSWAATLQANVTRHPLAGTTPAERLAEVLHRSARAFQRQPYLAKLVATLEVSSDPFATEILDRLDRATNHVYTAALEGVDAATIGPVVRVVESVLSGVLRSWSSGRLSMVDVLARLDEVVALVLHDPSMAGDEHTTVSSGAGPPPTR